MNVLTLTGRVLLVAGVAGLVACASSDREASYYVYDPFEPMVGESFVAADAKAETPKANPNWPKDFALAIDLELANIRTSKYRRPYVAVWIENPNVKDKAVRFLTVWGKEIKYQRDLRNFFPLSKFNGRVVDAVTRPTRSPGEYTVTWDGLDDSGKPVPAGDYVVHVEVAREHGTRVHMEKRITCKDQKKEEKLDGNVEVAGVVIHFGPVNK